MRFLLLAVVTLLFTACDGGDASMQDMSVKDLSAEAHDAAND